MELTIDPKDDVSSQREKMSSIRQRLNNFEKPYQKAGETLKKWVGDNIEAEGGLIEGGGSKWPPLSPKTLADRKRRGRGTKPLQDSGKLRRGVFFQTTGEKLKLGNAVAYAEFHQLGLGVPERPFFPGAVQAKNLCFPAFLNHVEEVLA